MLIPSPNVVLDSPLEVKIKIKIEIKKNFQQPPGAFN